VVHSYISKSALSTETNEVYVSIRDLDTASPCLDARQRSWM